jgi:hypothetical protein
MTIFATTLLLAGSFVLSDPGHLQTNTMLRDAAVDHDMANVKRQFERTLHGNTDSSHNASLTALPPIAR